MKLTAFLVAHIFTWKVWCPGMASAFVVPPCDQNMFHLYVFDCLSDFNKSMETSGYQKNCPWPEVKGIYFALTSCVDSQAVGSWCKGYQSVVDEVFMEVHQRKSLPTKGGHVCRTKPSYDSGNDDNSATL
ncbi:hypothetical protein OJAV_G00209310 [Oryzias javanicus]|uniref:Secreted protein n=1 Tax=Oryzias javanicus TaxID=123683 RepID=A0A437C7A4_ORYJA|nr:hypothetical protein OJAV_G00209310 [Oryzias javanicus]